MNQIAKEKDCVVKMGDYYHESSGFTGMRFFTNLQMSTVLKCKLNISLMVIPYMAGPISITIKI